VIGSAEIISKEEELVLEYGTADAALLETAIAAHAQFENALKNQGWIQHP